MEGSRPKSWKGHSRCFGVGKGASKHRPRFSKWLSRGFSILSGQSCCRQNVYGQGLGQGQNGERAGTTPVFAAAQPSARASLVLVVPALSRWFEYLQMQTRSMQTIVN